MLSRAGPKGETRWRSFTETAQHDFLHAGGWLVIGAMTAATLQVVVPRSGLDGVADHQVLAVVALAGLAVVAVVRHGRDQDGHQPHGPRVAWLLALPPLALVLIAPPALAQSRPAGRQSNRRPPCRPARPRAAPTPACSRRSYQSGFRF